MKHLHLLAWLVAALCPTTALYGQSDTLRQQMLHDVQVKGQRLRTKLSSPVAGVSIIDMSLMDDLPHILGNADPMHYTQLLPGIQTTSEYNAGLYVQGCDNQHNHVGIEGVPIYNASHLLGFFSIFNPTHFKGLRMSKSATTADAPNRLGGEVDMLMPDTIAQATHGNLSVGPMSSQGTLTLPTGATSALTLSARAAYLNLLYSRWMEVDDEQARYGFDDYNLSWQWQPTPVDRLRIDAYYGHDKVGYDDDDYTIDASLKWHNVMGALHWNHESRNLTLHQTLYATRYANDFTLDEDDLRISLPSDINSLGYKLKLAAHRWTAGIETAWHSVQPQNPKVEGFFNVDFRRQPRQHAIETSAFVGYEQPIAARLSASADLRLTHYHQQHDFWQLDPGLTLRYDEPTGGTLRLHAGTRHQNLFRVGFSEVALPTEFWLAANEQFKPQSVTTLSVSYERFLLNKMLRMEADIYYKWLQGQQEYSGNVYDFLYSTYDIGNMLLEGRGRNYGASLLIEKRKGRVTGWLSYAYGRAKRKFDDQQHHGWYPANHERPHELNAVATYRLSPRWSLGATYVFASGTPYTALKQFYMISNNIITEFYEHNANRVPPYKRLDLSVSYDFRTRKGHRSGINLSVYNVTMHNNVIYYRLKIYGGEFYRHPFSFILPLMPSLNYYYQF